MSTVYYTWTVVNKTLMDHGEDAVEEILEGPIGSLYTAPSLACEAARRDIIQTITEEIEALDDEEDIKLISTLEELMVSVEREKGTDGFSVDDVRRRLSREVELADTYIYAVFPMTVIE